MSQTTATAYVRGRVRARRCALQALYQWQLSGKDPNQILGEFIAGRELIKVDMDYFQCLTREIPAHIGILEQPLISVLDRPIHELPRWLWGPRLAAVGVQRMEFDRRVSRTSPAFRR